MAGAFVLVSFVSCWGGNWDPRVRMWGAVDPAPKPLQRSPEALATSPYGAWVQVGLASGRVVRGELLSVDEEELVVGGQRRVHRVPLSQVTDAALSAYHQGTKRGGLWTRLGLGSAASHGFWAAVSIPVWFVVGSISTRADSSAGFYFYKAGDGLDEFQSWRRWARFPQGMPEALRVVENGRNDG